MNAEDRTQLDLLEARVMAKLNELASQVNWFIKQYERDQLAIAEKLAERNKLVDDRLKDVEEEADKNKAWRNALPISTLLFAATAVTGIVALLLRG